MAKKSLFSSAFSMVAILGLTILILVISYLIVGERLEAHVYSVPEEERLTMIEGASGIELYEDMELAEGVTAASRLFDDDGETVAYVIDTVSGGSDGDVVVRVAFSDDYTIAALDVLETAGQPTNLGYRAAGSEYLDQYIGASSITSYAGSVSGRLIKSVEGADYSCTGVYSCVSAAFSQLEAIRAAEEEAE